AHIQTMLPSQLHWLHGEGLGFPLRRRQNRGSPAKCRQKSSRGSGASDVRLYSQSPRVRSPRLLLMSAPCLKLILWQRLCKRLLSTISAKFDGFRWHGMYTQQEKRRKTVTPYKTKN